MAKSLNEMTDEERWQLFPIILCEHKAIWKKRYIKEEALIRESIGSHNIKRISHIGSTAVPGLLSKPTIDILVEINRQTNTAELIYNMERQGYIYLEQPDNPPPHTIFLKGYTEQGFRGQAFHVHIRYSGDWDELYFRDYLLSHPETSAEYGKLKLELQKKYKHNRDAYTNAKTDFIKQVCKLARAEVKNSELSLKEE